MTKIELYPNEDITSALLRFRRKVHNEYKNRWYKKRYGYYEKPSTLDRKRKKMKIIVTLSTQRSMKLHGKPKAGGGLWLNIGQRERYERSGPDNTVGR